MSRVYVRQVVVPHTNQRNAEALLDEAIKKEKDTNAAFLTITSCGDDAVAIYTLVFERQ
jgi:cadmium resistance protein CadD (predicted permease)